MEIKLNQLIQTLNYYQKRHGDIPVYIGTDHGSDITLMTSNDYDLVDESKMNVNNPAPIHLIIGRDVSRE